MSVNKIILNTNFDQSLWIKLNNSNIKDLVLLNTLAPNDLLIIPTNINIKYIVKRN